MTLTTRAVNMIPGTKLQHHQQPTPPHHVSKKRTRWKMVCELSDPGGLEVADDANDRRRHQRRVTSHKSCLCDYRNLLTMGCHPGDAGNYCPPHPPTPYCRSVRSPNAGSVRLVEGSANVPREHVFTVRSVGISARQQPAPRV